jgi:serine/threonine protein kinase
LASLKTVLTMSNADVKTVPVDLSSQLLGDSAVELGAVLRGPAAEGSRAADSAGASATASRPPSELSFLGPPQQDDEIGRIGNYRILKQLGAGGMGLVFQAQDLVLDRVVALKVMKPVRDGMETLRRRFWREAKAAASLQHDHIVTIYQLGEDRDVLFLAMQFLEGEPLDARFKREGNLPVIEAVRIARQTAGGLAAAHDRRLVHRDIKPSNLWLEPIPAERGASAPGCRVKILDFGLARVSTDARHSLTKTGVIIGSPGYMSPEQANGQRVDFRSDLFSLGCVLYRMCTGQDPFRGDSILSTMVALATEDPPAVQLLNPAVPAELARLINKLLMKEPAARPMMTRLVVEALADLERALIARGDAAPRGPKPSTSTSPRAAQSDEAAAVDVRTPLPPGVPGSLLESLRAQAAGATKGAACPSGLLPTNSVIDVRAAEARLGELPAAPTGTTAGKTATKAGTAEGLGRCPRCGTARTSTAFGDWCSACGHHTALGTKPARANGRPRSAWAVLTAVVVGVLLAVGSAAFLAHSQLPERGAAEAAADMARLLPDAAAADDLVSIDRDRTLDQDAAERSTD